MSYIDVQKKYFTIKDLVKAVNKDKKWRIMVIDGKDRHIMPMPSLPA